MDAVPVIDPGAVELARLCEAECRSLLRAHRRYAEDEHTQALWWAAMGWRERALTILGWAVVEAMERRAGSERTAQ